MVGEDPVDIHISLLMVNDIVIGGAAAKLFDDVGYVPSDMAFTLPLADGALNSPQARLRRAGI